MGADEPKTNPERIQTDSSLKSERMKTDHELQRKRASIEEDADVVVEKARDRADAVTTSARQSLDEKLDREPRSAEIREDIAHEREVEDTSLAKERATEDHKLQGERDERKRALSRLLALERGSTDEHLYTERSRADEALSARDDFLAMVSHDLRTLLGGIALQAALLKRIPAADGQEQPVQKAAEKIQRFTARMNRLIGDLVDVASIEAGRLAVAPDKHDAVRLVRETMEAFQPLAAAKGVALSADIAKDSLLAKFDHERILQVLANLLSNAIKFTPIGGAIRLMVEPRGEDVCFVVTDTGSGIPPDKLTAVFERFWQVAQNDRRGLGLGLYISKCIVEAHGGRIWAESNGADGTTVTFSLPRVQEAPPERE